MTDSMEETARRIAELGNGALLRRLRPAFDHAAVTYASRITIRGDELEKMLEQAAQRAGAAIWRRALASVAMDELKIGLGEALEHPAVIRAQEIVGAPPLDWAALLAPSEPGHLSPPGLAPLEPAPAIAELSERQPEAPAPPRTLAEPEAPAPPDTLSAAVGAAEPVVLVEPTGPVQLLEPPLAATSALGPETIRLAAVHLDGIENLPRAGRYLELLFSEAGFDVVDAEGGDVIGRLHWDEIDAVELPSGRNSLGRRRRRARPQLVIRADRGEASFEIRGVTDDELREHLAPIMAKVRAAGRRSR